MERLDGRYIRGFTAGLQMAKNIINYISDDMRHHKRRMTAKELTKVFDCAIINREILRENSDSFIRCAASGGYEIFDSKLMEVINHEPHKETDT